MLSSSGVGGWERMDVLAGCLLNAQPAHCCSVSGNDDYLYVFYKRLNSQVMERERYLSVGMLVAYMQKTCDVAGKAILDKKKLRKKCVNCDKM